MAKISIEGKEEMIEAISDSLQYDGDFWVDMLDDSYGIDRGIAQEMINDLTLKKE